MAHGQHGYGRNEAFTIDARLTKARAAIVTPAEHVHQKAAYEDKPVHQFGFENNGKELAYVGASHTNNPESPVFAAIRAEFTRLKPDKVLIEGMSADTIEREVAHVRGLTEEEAMREGEPSYTLWLAVQAGVEYESPEPSDASQVLSAREAGFTEDEIFFSLFYRIMHRYLREHAEPSPDDCKAYIGRYFKRFRAYSGFPDETLDRLEEQALDEVDVSKEDFYASQSDPIPWEGVENTRTKQLAAYLTTARDRFALERIAKALKSHDRVLVVYGRSHAIMLEPAIRELFRN